MKPPKLDSLLIKPNSADCNLDCTYCFYAPKAALYPETKAHRMSDEVLREMVKQFTRMCPGQAAFSWQGGEPTLAGVDFFEQVVAYQKELGRPGQSIANSLQTNATLIDDRWARFLREYSFLIGCSLDGPKEIHDHYRLTHGGRGSFDRVMKGIECLQRNGVEYNILVLVNDVNVEKPKELLEFFLGNGFNWLQFISCVEPEADGDGAAPYAVPPRKLGQFLCAIFDEWAREEIPQFYVRDFEDLLIGYVRGEAASCMYAKRCGGYVVVEHNGDVYACDFHCDPEWKLGNLLETPLEEIAKTEMYAEFANRKLLLNEECQQCEWSEHCRGGCVKHRTAMGGDERSRTYLCEAYRTFFPHAHPHFLRLKEVAERQQAATRPPQVQPSKSISRNAPCPCGSGRKFKKCCGRG